MPLKQHNIQQPESGVALMEAQYNTSNWTTATATTPYFPVTTESNFTGNVTISPPDYTACRWILNHEIGSSRVRVWDVIILVPNLAFLLFLLIKLRTTYTKLKHTSSPIFFAFYGMVFVVAVISVLRCVVSMTVNAALPAGDRTDKVLWLILRFFLLATELSVVIFGLAFGHLDSKTSIRRVLLLTSFIALTYSVTQGTLEFLHPDERFRVKDVDRKYDIFGHGGMMFWFISSLFFFLVYSVIFILPYTKLKQRFTLPPKRSFYWYCLFLACLNLIQAIGSGLLYFNQPNGLCVVDVTTFIYFTGFAPLVYLTFLRDFFRTSQPPNILFSYKAQVDDAGDDDRLSMPHQATKTDDDEPLSLYDSTHFGNSPNPLYSVDPQANFEGAVLSINQDDISAYDKPFEAENVDNVRVVT